MFVHQIAGSNKQHKHQGHEDDWKDNVLPQKIWKSREESTRDEECRHNSFPAWDCKCELDTRADTSCAGINFCMLSSTGQTCDVKGFHDDSKSIKDVTIARVATAFKDSDGMTHILIVNEALYFEQQMAMCLVV